MAFVVGKPEVGKKLNPARVSVRWDTQVMRNTWDLWVAVGIDNCKRLLARVIDRCPLKCSFNNYCTD